MPGRCISTAPVGQLFHVLAAQCLTTSNFPGFQGWDQPNSRSSGGSFPLKPQALGECGVTSNAPNRAAAEARIPVPLTRTAALPRLLSEGVQFAISIPVDDDARPSSTPPSPCHDTPLEKTDDTAQEGLAARSSCTSIGRIVSVPRRLNNTVDKHLYRPPPRTE